MVEHRHSSDCREGTKRHRLMKEALQEDYERTAARLARELRRHRVVEVEKIARLRELRLAKDGAELPAKTSPTRPPKREPRLRPDRRSPMGKWKIVEAHDGTGAETFREVDSFDVAITTVLDGLNTPNDRVIRVEGPDGEVFGRWWFERKSEAHL